MKLTNVLELAECLMQAYEKTCRPLCQELGMTQESILVTFLHFLHWCDTIINESPDK